jgi:hypothetical protein
VPGEIAGEDTGDKAEAGAVGQLKRVFGIIGLLNGENRAENLFLHQFIPGGPVGNDCGFYEIALAGFGIA